MSFHWLPQAPSRTTVEHHRHLHLRYKLHLHRKLWRRRHLLLQISKTTIVRLLHFQTKIRCSFLFGEQTQTRIEFRTLLIWIGIIYSLRLFIGVDLVSYLSYWGDGSDSHRVMVWWWLSFGNNWRRRGVFGIVKIKSYYVLVRIMKKLLIKNYKYNLKRSERNQNLNKRVFWSFIMTKGWVIKKYISRKDRMVAAKIFI